MSEETNFVHSASLSLGGSREDCARLACRASRINELARFALLYSDRVHINNFFSDYHHYRTAVIEHEIKQTFFEDVYLLSLMKPLIEMGTIALFTPPQNRCVHSWANQAFGLEGTKKLERERKRLEGEYLANTVITLEQAGGRYGLRCKGPKPYFEHGGLVNVRTSLPDTLTSKPRIMKRLLCGKPVTLAQTTRKQLQLHKRFAWQVVSNISYELSTSQLLNTSFLTDKTLHISFLQSISNDAGIEHRNRIAQKYLTSIVPFLAEVDIKGLVKLRQREGEAFIQYRRALNEAIDEFRSKSSRFSEKNARALCSDVIAPRLSSLEQRLSSARQDLVGKSYRSVIAVVGAISFGIYTGFIPTEVAEMARVLGFTKIAADILEKLLTVGDAERAVKNDDLYFLWKVKKLGKSK